MNNLLMLHGALGSKSQFKTITEYISSNFNVHSINFSGHGGERIPDDPFNIKVFADDVIEYLDVNGIRKINIFGYSMGGYVGLYLAKNYPGRIGKVFTLATKFEWNTVVSALEVKKLDANKIKEKIPEFAKELSKRHSPQNWEAVLDKTAEMMINLGKKNILTLQEYSDIENEVMVAIGDRDKMVTFEETVAVYQKLQCGRLLVMPNTPHPFEQANVERLAYEIKNFFI